MSNLKLLIFRNIFEKHSFLNRIKITVLQIKILLKLFFDKYLFLQYFRENEF